MIGITESGDPAFDNSWKDKITKVNGVILITKCLHDVLIDEILEHKEKVILHITCTGNEKVFEPNSPDINWTFSQVQKLLAKGFKAEKITLRIDPIIPTVGKGNIIKSILETFKNTGINRVRFSFIDLYPHVIQRFNQAGIKLYWNTFCVPENIVEKYIELFKQYSNTYNFECCAETYKCIPDNWKIGCVSKKDMQLLNVKHYNNEAKGQRKTCLCIAEKTELLTAGLKGNKCPMQCLCCIWK